MVDSSVWIHVFRLRAPERLSPVERIIEKEAATCGVVIQEVLQGIQPVRYVEEIRQSLLRHYYLETPLTVYFRAAGYSRECRAKGLALSTVDALIAAIAMHHGADLWTRDQDFVRAARILPLKLYQPSRIG